MYAGMLLVAFSVSEYWPEDSAQLSPPTGTTAATASAATASVRRSPLTPAAEPTHSCWIPSITATTAAAWITTIRTPVPGCTSRFGRCSTS
jgi:hypothetical protein